MEGKLWCIACKEFVDDIKFKKDNEKIYLACRKCRKKMKDNEPWKTKLRN